MAKSRMFVLRKALSSSASIFIFSCWSILAPSISSMASCATISLRLSSSSLCLARSPTSVYQSTCSSRMMDFQLRPSDIISSTLAVFSGLMASSLRLFSPAATMAFSISFFTSSRWLGGLLSGACSFGFFGIRHSETANKPHYKQINNMSHLIVSQACYQSTPTISKWDVTFTPFPPSPNTKHMSVFLGEHMTGGLPKIFLT